LRNGTERDYGIKYLADGDVINTQAPSRRKSIKIDPAQLRGTVDQLTAYFLVEQQLGRTGSCRAVVPVYDGNEVYRMRFTDIKDETLVPDRHQHFGGTTRLCENVRDVVAANPDVDESTYDRARLWYARLLPDGRMLPVRMEYETPFGNVNGYLADINGFGLYLNFRRRVGRLGSIEPWDNPVRHPLTILLPIRAISHRAHVVVAPFAVNQQDCEVEDIKVGQRAPEQRRQTPGETHHQVSKIIHMPCQPPPPRVQKQ
jgi:hypothetical protein